MSPVLFIVANNINICYNIKMQKVFFRDITYIPNDIKMKVLCEKRQNYIDEIKDIFRKRQSILVWKLLEYVFYRYFTISDVGFFADKSGKWMSDRTDYYFSLAHSENIIAVVISDCKNIGIDVEKVSEKVFKAARYILRKEITDRNSEEVDGLIKSETAESLTLKWTDKESAFKSGNNSPCFTNCFIYDADKNKYCLSVASEKKGIELIKIGAEELVSDVHGNT